VWWWVHFTVAVQCDRQMDRNQVMLSHWMKHKPLALANGDLALSFLRPLYWIPDERGIAFATLKWQHTHQNFFCHTDAVKYVLAAWIAVCQSRHSWSVCDWGRSVAMVCSRYKLTLTIYSCTFGDLLLMKSMHVVLLLWQFFYCRASFLPRLHYGVWCIHTHTHTPV